MPKQRPPVPGLAPSRAAQGRTYSTRRHCCTARGPHSLAAEMAAVRGLPYHDSGQSSVPTTKRWQEP
eukprot:8491763-Lingulodinium_polyedra.AAC.1